MLSGCGGKAEPKFNDSSAEPKVTISDPVPIAEAIYMNAEVGDLNQDGFDDVVAIGLSGEFTVLINNQLGQLTQTAATNQIVTGALYGLADTNHDGKLDVVTRKGQTLFVALGRGDGSFAGADPQSATWLQGFSEMDVGHFNGDGLLDAVASNELGVTLLLANGLGGYTQSVISDRLGTVRVADFNADGLDDVLVSGYYRVTLLMGNGDGTFKSPQFTDVEEFSLGESQKIRFGDVDGDDWLDIAFLSGARVQVYRNEHGQGFKKILSLGVNAADYDVDTFYLDSFTLADMNCDGTQDIVLAEFVSRTVKILVSNADGTFRKAIEPDSSKKLFRVVTVDVNADGAQDLFALPSGEVYTNESCSP